MGRHHGSARRRFGLLLSENGPPLDDFRREANGGVVHRRLGILLVRPVALLGFAALFAVKLSFTEVLIDECGSAARSARRQSRKSFFG